MKREWWLDLPELTSIQLGNSAFWFNSDESSELILRSDDDELNWWIDLPKLTSLTSLTTEGDYSSTFEYPHSITLEGMSYHSSSQADLPSLTTVTLNKRWVFKYKRNAHTRSSSSASLSFLDITPALQQYLSFPLSFTHYSCSFLTYPTNCKSLPH